MDDNQRKLDGQRYFIRKLSEYITSEKSPFFRKALEEKRHDSLIRMFNESLEVDGAIRNNVSDRSKLKNSLNSTLKNLSFHCEQNPWIVKGNFSRDFKYLNDCIKNKLKNENNESFMLAIRNSISALLKRFDSDILIKEYTEFILECSLSFKQIDLLVQYFVSELINMGYSLKYLMEWKKENRKELRTFGGIGKEELEVRILKLRELIKEPISYQVLINSWLPDQLINELKKEGYIEINGNFYKEAEKFLPQQPELFFPKSDKYYSLIVKITAYDKYKAIEPVVKNLENYIEMYKYLYDFQKPAAVNVNCLLKENQEGQWIKMRTDTTDAYLFNRNMNHRENSDIKDFLELREKVRKAEENNKSILVLNNSLGMLKSTVEYSPENRLLNNWSSLEYLLNFYDGKSIISKVIDIIPKVICLYHIKDKLNVFWERIILTKERKAYKREAILEDLFDQCKKEDNRFDKFKLIEFLNNDSHLEDLKNYFYKINIGSYRQIVYIRELLKNNENIHKHIHLLHEELEHDLTRIYRIRNLITHSGNGIDFNVDIYTIRLNKYITSLLGTLIHYIKRQPNLTIEEVLNSIHETYDWYINALNNKGIDIKIKAFPPYLYL